MIGFLSVTSPNWDPALLAVMGGALCIALPSFQYIIKTAKTPEKPQADKNIRVNLLQKPFPVFNNDTVDTKLVLGMALFGFGWGLTGICPGPAVVSLQYSFLAAMGVGMYLASYL